MPGARTVQSALAGTARATDAQSPEKINDSVNASHISEINLMDASASRHVQRGHVLGAIRMSWPLVQ